MAILNYEEKADRKHLKGEEDIWTRDIFHQMELITIEEAMRRKIAEVHGADRNIKDLSTGFAAIENDIRTKYLSNAPNLPQFHKDAQDKKLENGIPKKGVIASFRAGFVIAIVAEFSVMLVQSAVAEFNPFILVLAAVLFSGGFLQGKGGGFLAYDKWEETTGRKENIESKKNIFLIVVGTVLIVAVAGIRAYSLEREQMAIVFIITLLFGEAVAVFEGFAVYYKQKRECYLRDMTDSQKFTAYHTHKKFLEDGTYKERYKEIFRSVHQEGYSL